MHIVRYRLYPNNEIRATHYYNAPKRQRLVSEDNSSEDLSCPDTASSAESEGETAFPSYLTLATILHSGVRSLAHKRTKFGANAKHTLLRTGGAYDTLSIDPGDFIFLTGTLPGSTTDAYWAIAEYSAYIAHSLNQWIKRTINSEHYFYVWELQKRGALHFHYCVYVPDKQSRDKTLAGFKSKWTSLLDDISQRSGVCMWSSPNGTCWTDRYGTLQAYAQAVHTSVAAYLSGYLGGAKDKHSQDEASPYYPSRWWGCSRKSSSLLKALTEEVVSEHTDYRSARYEIQVHYEQVLHDSPKAYHYPHEVGIGSTVVSYHPEDKGTHIWRHLNPMLYTETSHPNTAYMIARTRQTLQETISFLSVSRKFIKDSYLPLSRSLEALDFPGTARGYSISQRAISLLLEIPCSLDSSFTEVPPPEKWRKNCVLMQRAWQANLPKLTYDRYGYLNITRDLIHTVDNFSFIGESSTTEAKAEDAVSGAAHGSISPQNPLSHQIPLF